MTSRPLTTLADPDLAARFRAGGAAAFEETHRRYRRPLLAFARRMLNGAGHDADDVVQDAFVRAFAACASRAARWRCARGCTRSSAIGRSTSCARRSAATATTTSSRACRRPRATPVPATKSLIVRARANLGAARCAA